MNVIGKITTTDTNAVVTGTAVTVHLSNIATEDVFFSGNAEPINPEASAFLWTNHDNLPLIVSRVKEYTLSPDKTSIQMLSLVLSNSDTSLIGVNIPNLVEFIAQYNTAAMFLVHGNADTAFLNNCKIITHNGVTYYQQERYSIGMRADAGTDKVPNMVTIQRGILLYYTTTKLPVQADIDVLKKYQQNLVH